MTSKSLSWAPAIATAIAMYLAKASHIAVLHYNVFLLSILAWCGGLIGFYRLLHWAGARNDDESSRQT
jgi:hypothetical protein